MRISTEEFAKVTAAIHAAATTPERWPEALSAVAQHFTSPELDERRDAGWQTVLRSLDGLHVPAFIVSRVGMVRHLNTSAHALLEREPSVKVVQLGLRLSSPSVHARFRIALRRATPPDPQSSVFAMPTGVNTVYEFNVSPLEGWETTGLAGAAPHALVIVTRPHLDAERIADRVRRLHGLTFAEARVTAALALGDTVEQIAVAHGVRTSTVRAQVRTIFEKTGVHRQAQLIRLALIGQPLFARSDR